MLALLVQLVVPGGITGIANPTGSERSGVDPDSKPWSVTMKAHYGYVKGNKGGDGEQVDVYVGENAASQVAFVVDHIDPTTGKFDEHKVVLGEINLNRAKRLYDQHFSDSSGSKRWGAITKMPMDEFKKWVNSRTAKKAVAYIEHKEPSHQDNQHIVNGDFGPVYRKFKHKTQKAITFLKKMQEGEAVSALTHPVVGDIDLVWGKEGTQENEFEDGFGLAKIFRKHPEVTDSLQKIINTLNVTQKRKAKTPSMLVT
jgi:hypothetical protein